MELRHLRSFLAVALGFEYNGMVLHEYSFGSMTREGAGIRPAGRGSSTPPSCAS